ncbi:MAG: NnrS family protein [Pseudomonadota bacterium]
MRRWSGPAILSFGFRPFFLSAALWAVVAIVIFVGMLTGALAMPIAFDPTSWHAHEFLFGYLGAVLAGFLLTAIPNWTGRPPVVGWPLAGLWLLWLLGRVAMASGENWPPAWLAATDLSFFVALALVALREVIAGRNWRNLVVIAMVGVLIGANVLFHMELHWDGYAASGSGLRLGVAAAMMMIAVIGGRIVPLFTRNWLVKRDSALLPPAPMQPFDKICLLVWLLALAAWVAWPEHLATACALLIAGCLHVVRLWRWQGRQTGAEPLVWILHVGYGFLPLGAILMALAIVVEDALWAVAAQHAWMAGGIGVMTLAVMTRAILGHTNRALHAGPGTMLIYLALIGSVLCRLAVAAVPELAHLLYMISAGAWCLAYLGFVALYGPLVFRPRLSES